MKIIQLTSENVKRIAVVQIKPDGNVIVVGGKNGQGKSSVLDSIQWALGGEPDAKMPVRRGEEKAKIVADLGDLVVTRTITPSGGGTLVVRNADGVRQDSPQTILDKLVGKLTFDPLAFSRQKPKEQAETLRGLVGLDFTQQDKEREKVFATRTGVNREAAALKARMDAMPKHEGVPAEEQSAGEIMAQQARAVATNANNQAQRNAADAAKRELESFVDAIAELRRQAEELAKRITAGEKIIEQRKASAEALSEAVSKLEDVDVSGYHEKLTKLEADNQKFRANKARNAVVEQYKAKVKEAEDLTANLEKLDAEKRAKINSTKYPIEGLAFDTAGGVVLDGIPFEQSSSAEQLRVSVAIGLALNPKLRILLIRDGSLLDQDSLKLVAEMAAKAEAQVWLERVGQDASTSVVIEDGRILKQPSKEPQKPGEPPQLL